MRHIHELSEVPVSKKRTTISRSRAKAKRAPGSVGKKERKFAGGRSEVDFNFGWTEYMLSDPTSARSEIPTRSEKKKKR
jgi:hypothetical protein